MLSSVFTQLALVAAVLAQDPAGNEFQPPTATDRE